MKSCAGRQRVANQPASAFKARAVDHQRPSRGGHDHIDCCGTTPYTCLVVYGMQYTYRYRYIMHIIYAGWDSNTDSLTPYLT